MAQVLDSTTGQLVEHPDADVAADWSSGKVQPIAGQTYHLRFANGEYGQASDPAVIARAVQQGAQFVAPEQAQAGAAAQKYESSTGGAIGAGLAGGLSQATFGLSDVAGRALVGEGFAKARQYQEQAHPYATMIGEGVGAGALAALTGGGSLAEQGVAEGLGEGLSSIATRTLAKGAAGLAEGAQFGVSQSISQAAVQDPKLTAEQVIANVGANALWGGILGGGLGAAGSLFGGRGTGRLEAALARDPDAEGLASVAGKALGVDAPADGLGDKLARGFAKLSGAVSGHDPEAILDVLENRGALLGAEEERNAASRAIRQHVDTVLSASRDIQQEAMGDLKRSYVRAAMDGVDVAEARARAQALVDHTTSTLDEMLGKGEDYGGAAPLGRARTLAERATKALTEASDANDPAAMFSTVDDLKKAIGKYTKGASKLSPMAATDELVSLQNKARAMKLQDLYETLRAGLEDEGVWKKAGADQRAINAAWTQQIDASSRFHSALTTDVGRDPSNPWNTIRGVDPAKADAYVRGLLDPSKDLTHKAVTDYVTSTKRLADVMAEAYELPAAKAAKVRELGKAADAFRDTLDDTGKKLALVNQYESLREQTAGHAMAFGAVAGHLVGGLPGGWAGAALGKGVDALAHPAETIRKLAVLEQMARSSDGRIARTLRAFGRGNARPSPAEGLSQYPRRAAQIERLAADPQAVTARAQAAAAPLASHAPKVTEALVGTALAGVQFLASKLPAKPALDPLDPKAKAPLPPPAQREAFQRYYRAVQDPHTVLEDLRDGRLNLEGVEALKTVYPSLYGRVQKTALDELSAGKLEDLTVGQRYGLATMLDLPVPELSPAYISARQQAASAPLGAFDPQPQQGTSGQKPNKRSKPLPEKKPSLLAESLESPE